MTTKFVKICQIPGGEGHPCGKGPPPAVAVGLSH